MLCGSGWDVLGRDTATTGPSLEKEKNDRASERVAMICCWSQIEMGLGLVQALQGVKSLEESRGGIELSCDDVVVYDLNCCSLKSMHDVDIRSSLLHVMDLVVRHPEMHQSRPKVRLMNAFLTSTTPT